MWADFNPKALTREQFTSRLAELKWASWKPVGIVLHNTAAPTLAGWVESGPAHAARIRNLQHYYEMEMGWHAGPHWFVSRSHINEFSNPLKSGIHSRCFNKTHFGIEMVGDYAREPFNSGDGALVRDNAVFVMAALCRKLGWQPADLKFHKECKLDNHDCPGKFVSKADMIARVQAAMGQAPKTEGHNANVLFNVSGKMSTFGGPSDTGMTPTEGLALFNSDEEMTRHGIAALPVKNGVTGLGRRLDPNTYYVACRWDYSKTPKSFLQSAKAAVSANGKSIVARPVDWGPNERTGRVADLSPKLAQDLGLKTDDICTVTIKET
jgi:hypothetical protein